MYLPGNIRLFLHINPSELTRLLSCLSIRQVRYSRGETILREGASIDSIGVVLNGRVQILRNEYDGNRSIISSFGVGEVFGESFVCAGETVCPVGVVASEECDILFLPYAKMLRFCSKACGSHSQLLENMMKLLAEKNLHLSEKLAVASKRTIRDRVVRYLDGLSRESGQNIVEIPFSRGEFADYLYVDRSALSRELGRMERDQLISISGKTFQVLWGYKN